MTANEEVRAAVAAIDTATTELGTRIAFLVSEADRTATEGLSPAQTTWLLDGLRPLPASLNAMGRTATPPVLPPQPTPIPGPFA